MTLEEAIKHTEEVAKEKESEAQDLKYSKLDWRHEANQCSECAEEHRQLAEWLKELKVYKEKESLDPSEELAKAFTIGMAMGFAKKYDEMDAIMKAIKALAQKPKTGRWKRMSDLPNDVDDRFECSRCGNVVHYNNVMNLRTFSRWCGRCGSDNG